MLEDMGFFDGPAPPARDQDEPAPAGGPWVRPATEFARVAASGLLLARTDDIAVAVTAVWAYRDGFEFWLKARFRQGDALAEGPYDPVDDSSLHVGVQFADGRKAVNAGTVPSQAGSEAEGLILRPYSFGGGHFHTDRSYWVWPLPPAGPVTFACRWAARGIAESRIEVDGQLIRDTAEHSIQLWPAADNQPPDGS